MNTAMLLALFGSLFAAAPPPGGPMPAPAELRARGPAAVEEAIGMGMPDEMLDRVCAQKDCRFSRLYWYTDLQAAQAEAHRRGHPILSLRLLGGLDEEVSCANSRFFRTILYPDPAISDLLRENFVLHWESVRPVPRITIELGDGRVIRQTITGNSAHYLLDEEGRPLDVLPGMVSPAAFLAQIEEWTALHARMTGASDRDAVLARYHAERITRSIETRRPYLDTPIVMVESPSGAPTAVDAARLAVTKSAVELPVITKLDPKASLRDLPQSFWDAMGEVRKDGVVFSGPALALMQRKQPLDEAILDRLRTAIAIDTALNQQELHYRAHLWFEAGEVHDLAALNERVYAELFLTPLDDPWMGLKPREVYAALGEE